MIVTDHPPAMIILCNDSPRFKRYGQDRVVAAIGRAKYQAVGQALCRGISRLPPWTDPRPIFGPRQRSKQLRELWTLGCKNGGGGGQRAFDHWRSGCVTSAPFASKRLPVRFDQSETPRDKNATNKFR
jgi:hypothetical protein